MADDVALTREVAAPSDHFRGIAKSAGMKMKKAVQEDTNPASKTPVYVSFDVDRYRDDLKELMDQFKEQEFSQTHPRGTLVWRRIFVMLKATSFNDDTYSKRPEDAWFLALSVSREDSVGQSFSLHRSFSVESGDIYLGYVII